MTAAALLGFSVSPSIFFMCLFALPLGMGAGAVDVALNDYVSLHYSATHTSFLHCFYGVGVSVSPYIMSLVIGGKYGWRGGYLIAFFIQGALSLLLFCTLPVWKRFAEMNTTKAEKKPLFPLKAHSKSPERRKCACFLYAPVPSNGAAGLGSTFLVEHKHLSAELAARIIMLFYIGMALGRFLSGMLAAKLHSWTIIKFSQILLGVALAFLHTGTVGNIGRRAVSCGAEQRSPFPEFQFSHSRKLRKRRFPLGHERSNGGGLCWNPFRSRSLRSGRPGLRHGDFPLFHFVFLYNHGSVDRFHKKTHSKEQGETS